jgi:hypothetical protein
MFDRNSAAVDDGYDILAGVLSCPDSSSGDMRRSSNFVIVPLPTGGLDRESMVRAYSQCAFAIALVLFVAETSQADFVVGYAAIDTTGDLTAIDGTGVTGSTLSRGTDINDEVSVSGLDYNSSMWNQSLDVDNSWQFSFTSTLPYDLTSLQVRAQTFDAGPVTLQLQIDSGSGFVALGGDQSVSTVSPTDVVFNFSVLNVSSASIRIIGFNSSNSGANSQLAIMHDGNYSGAADLVVNGTLAAIPEPSAALFGGLVCGVIALAAASRRIVGKPAVVNAA